MAKEIRLKRIESFLHKEISEIISMKVMDEGIRAMITVLDVKVSKDMRYAAVKLVIFSNDESNLKSTVKALIRAKSFIKRTLSKSLRTRYVPEIWFEFINFDESSKVYEKINAIEEKF